MIPLLKNLLLNTDHEPQEKDRSEKIRLLSSSTWGPIQIDVWVIQCGTALGLMRETYLTEPSSFKKEYTKYIEMSSLIASRSFNFFVCLYVQNWQHRA